MSAQIILTLTRPKNGSVLSKSEQEWSVRSRGFKKIGFIKIPMISNLHDRSTTNARKKLLDNYNWKWEWLIANCTLTFVLKKLVKNFISEYLNLRYLTQKCRVLQSNKQTQSDLSR